MSYSPKLALRASLALNSVLATEGWLTMTFEREGSDV
jgi:hypothetical protein